MVTYITSFLNSLLAPVPLLSAITGAALGSRVAQQHPLAIWLTQSVLHRAVLPSVVPPPPSPSVSTGFFFLHLVLYSCQSVTSVPLFWVYIYAWYMILFLFLTYLLPMTDTWSTLIQPSYYSSRSVSAWQCGTSGCVASG